MPKKRSFLERLTGSVSLDDDAIDHSEIDVQHEGKNNEWLEEDTEDGQLSIDVFQTPDEILIQAMIAGVRHDDLHVSISRDMVTIKGERQRSQNIVEDDYFYQELYWGGFTRSILLPQEVDPEGAEAVEKHGLLTIRLPKLDKEKTKKIRVKSG